MPSLIKDLFNWTKELFDGGRPQQNNTNEINLLLNDPISELPRHDNSSKHRSMPLLFPISDVCSTETVHENVMIIQFSFFC